MLPVITVKADGLEEAMSMIVNARKILDKAGNTVKGVALHEKKREDSNDDGNAEIVEKLIASGRDFFNLNDADAQKCANAFTEELDRTLARYEKRKKPLTDSLAGTAARRAYIAAMMVYMEIVTERIKEQRTADGGSPAKLSETYSKFKQAFYGFTDPVGVATGQLLANLDPSAKSNIRTKRGDNLR